MKGFNLNVYRTVTVHDIKTGKLISKQIKRSESFVIAFLQIVECQFYPSVNVSVVDTGGTPRSCPDGLTNLNIEVGAGSDTYGLFVGTGTTTPTNSDYAPETQIAHGAGAGQLNYGATSKTTAQEVGANVDLIITRTFTNSSGGTINVTEYGIIGKIFNGSAYGLFLHDVDSATAVNNGQVMTVSYTFRTTV